MSGNPRADPFKGVSPHIFNPEGMGDCGLLRNPAKIPGPLGELDLRCPSLRKRISYKNNRYEQETVSKFHPTSLTL